MCVVVCSYIALAFLRTMACNDSCGDVVVRIYGRVQLDPGAMLSPVIGYLPVRGLKRTAKYGNSTPDSPYFGGGVLLSTGLVKVGVGTPPPPCSPHPLRGRGGEHGGGGNSGTRGTGLVVLIY